MVEASCEASRDGLPFLSSLLALLANLPDLSVLRTGPSPLPRTADRGCRMVAAWQKQPGIRQRARRPGIQFGSSGATETVRNTSSNRCPAVGTADAEIKVPFC